MHHTRIVLASQSPRRKLLLKQIGLNFSVRPSKVEERFNHNQSPSRNAKRIALEKALDVARNVKQGIVVGADTIVVVGKRILGKPRTKAEAIRMLKFLSGREHVVYTALALVDSSSKKQIVEIERTKVRFRKLSEKEIKAYVNSGSPMDKAGAYGIQDDYGAVFVEKINGCFYNVVGFPLTRFHTALNKFVNELNRTLK